MKHAPSVLLIATLLLLNCAPRPRVAAPTGLILRSAPATSAAVVGTIPFRKELKVIETSAEKVKIEGIEAPWQKVSYEGKEGWVFSGFLTNDAAVLDRIEKCPATHRVFGQQCIPAWQYGLQSQGLAIDVENDCGYMHLLKPDGSVDGFQGKTGCGSGPYRGRAW
ncbi:MAG: SH3 domain-containing protein [Leptospirales bacterium]|nr:SH3 domain-containing protein [Leptospirales bacterium]